ncbi:MAG: sigma-54-dependent transcriptional regulator [Planctomycetota bacterium]
MAGNVLLVDDDLLVRRSLSSGLRSAGHRVREADSVALATRSLAAEEFDVVVVDYRLGDGTGFDVMAQVAEKHPGTPVLMVTAHASVDHAVEAMRRGAFMYVQKPVEPGTLEAHVDKALETADLHRENQRLRRLAEPSPGAEAFLGTSSAARALREQIQRVAVSPVRAVLLEGESGTGKGLVARVLHEESPRSAKPFVSITCSAMPEQLLESELFGHEPGAFTDARKRKMGLLEAAQGGSLFLDEIGDMAAPLQAKLLGVLEDRRIRRLGGVQEIDVDVRVISATHRDLRALVAEGRFREDLLYRLRVVPVRIPALRERTEDVAVLAEHFVARIAAEWGRPPLRLSAEAVAALRARPWPGNVRELRNAVERAVILARGDELMAVDFRDDAAEGASAAAAVTLPAAGVNVEDVVDDLVRQALVRSDGNQSAAARLLGMSRDQVRYRMQRMAGATGGAAEGGA